jgi:hypothetical protein
MADSNLQLATQQHRSTAHNRSMERIRRPGYPTPPKNNNSIVESVGNEENEHPVPDPNRAMINITNELSNAPRKICQRGKHGQDH